MVKCIDCVCLYPRLLSLKDETKNFCIRLNEYIEDVDLEIECGNYLYIPDFETRTKIHSLRDMSLAPM
jgi:hypothetical protein